MAERETDPQLFEPRMPELDFPPDLEGIFAKPRRVGTGELTPPVSPNKHVAVVTPGRMIMMHPCPAPGTMTPSTIESVEKLLPSSARKKVTIIAFTELEALRADLKRAIP